MTLHIHRVPVTPIRQNCLILTSDMPEAKGCAVVVDPGGDVDRIIEELGDLQVTAILLTHGHFDHAGGVEELADRMKAKFGKRPTVYGPDKRDAFLLECVAEQGRSFDINDMRDVTPDLWTEEGQILKLLGENFDVLHVPGHTPGHVVFHNAESKQLMCGDTLFHGTVGRSDFRYGDGAQLVDGIKKKLLILPDDTAVLCGHGRPTTIGEEKRENPHLQ